MLNSNIDLRLNSDTDKFLLKYGFLYSPAYSFPIEEHSKTEQKYGDLPYHWHLFQVKGRTKVLFPNLCTKGSMFIQLLALNHDLLEDCPNVTIAQLRTQGYPEQLITSMKAITKLEGETRSEYLTRCMEDKAAHLVKIADTMCNLEQSVISFDKVRVGKYSKQLKKLIDGWENN